MIFNDVVDALVTLFAAAVSVPVYDGPNPQSVNNGNFLLVGSTGEEEDGGSVAQELADLGPGEWLMESGEVVCSAWSWSGGADIADRRAAATGLVSACAAAVASDASLGGLLVAPGRADVSQMRYQPRQTETGAICRFVFTVSYSSLIT